MAGPFERAVQRRFHEFGRLFDGAGNEWIR